MEGELIDKMFSGTLSSMQTMMYEKGRVSPNQSGGQRAHCQDRGLPRNGWRANWEKIPKTFLLNGGINCITVKNVFVYGRLHCHDPVTSLKILLWTFMAITGPKLRIMRLRS